MQIEPNDAVLVRTGYMGVWPEAGSQDFHGAGSRTRRPCTSRIVERWSLEPTPSPWRSFLRWWRESPSVHIELLNKRGIHIMEMVYLEELARDKVYEFLFVTSPLKIRGASGSMVRPLAVV